MPKTIPASFEKMVPLAILEKILPKEKISEIENLLEDLEASKSQSFLISIEKAQKNFNKNGAISSKDFFAQFKK